MSAPAWLVHVARWDGGLPYVVPVRAADEQAALDAARKKRRDKRDRAESAIPVDSRDRGGRWIA